MQLTALTGTSSQSLRTTHEQHARQAAASAVTTASDDFDVDQAVSAWLLSTGYKPVNMRCSLFARKFQFLPAHPPSTTTRVRPAYNSSTSDQLAHSGIRSEPCMRGQEAGKGERLDLRGAASAQRAPAQAREQVWKAGGSSWGVNLKAASDRDAVLEWALSCERGLGMGDHCSQGSA